MLKTSVAVICHKSCTRKCRNYLLMLRLTQKGQRKYRSIGVDIPPEQWDFQKNEPKRSYPYRDSVMRLIAAILFKYRKQIDEFNEEGRDYSLSMLINTVEQPTKRMTFGAFLDEHVAWLKAQKRLGYAASFIDLKNTLQNHLGTLDFMFSDINSSFLRAFVSYQRSNGNELNTIGIRLRCLRVLFNKAIEENVVRREYYPFSKFKISDYAESTAKRAITKADIKRIIELDPREVSGYHTPYLFLGKDIFLFSYLSCGINFWDIAKMKYGDIADGTLTYRRQKTGSLISFKLHPMALQIIDKYRKENWTDNDYIFPILDRGAHLTDTQIRDRIVSARKRTNHALKKIGAYLDIPLKLTTYVARHSYATVMKRSGVSTAIISESLGHSSEKITQIYLDSFENSQVSEAMTNLL